MKGGNSVEILLFTFWNAKSILKGENSPPVRKFFPFRVDLFQKGLVCKKANRKSQKVCKADHFLEGLVCRKPSRK